MFQEVLHIWIPGYGTLNCAEGNSSGYKGGAGGATSTGGLGPNPALPAGVGRREHPGDSSGAQGLPNMRRSRSDSSTNIERYNRSKSTSATNPVHAGSYSSSTSVYIGGISNSNAGVSTAGNSSQHVHGGYPTPTPNPSTSTSTSTINAALTPRGDDISSSGSGGSNIHASNTAAPAYVNVNVIPPAAATGGYIPLSTANKRNQNSANLLYDNQTRGDIPNNAIELFASVTSGRNMQRSKSNISETDIPLVDNYSNGTSPSTSTVSSNSYHLGYDDIGSGSDLKDVGDTASDTPFLAESDRQTGLGNGGSSSTLGPVGEEAYAGTVYSQQVQGLQGSGMPTKEDLGTAGYLWNTESKECFVFAFGGVVLWGFTKEEEDDLIDYIRHFASKDLLDEEEITKSEDDMAFAINVTQMQAFVSAHVPTEAPNEHDNVHALDLSDAPREVDKEEASVRPHAHARTYTEDFSGTDQDSEAAGREGGEERLHKHRTSYAQNIPVREREHARARPTSPRDPSNTYIEKRFIHNMKNQGPKGINIINKAFDADPASEILRIDNDVIYLPEATSTRQRLALSFAVAQSSVLAVFEARIQKRVDEYRYIPGMYRIFYSAPHALLHVLWRVSCVFSCLVFICAS